MAKPRVPTEKQIERLRAALARADLRQDEALQRRLDEARAVTRKHYPREVAAEKAVNRARAALTIAELARQGIAPMHSVVQFQARLWAVHVNRYGWPSLVPLKSDLTPHLGRNETFFPARWEGKVIVTDKVMKS